MLIRYTILFQFFFLLCQIILLIYISVKIQNYLNLEDVQLYNQSTIDLSMTIDIIILVSTLPIIINVIIQAISMFRLVRFLMENRKWLRRLFYLLLFPLILYFLNENFRMILFYWGSPAVHMTMKTTSNKDFLCYTYFFENHENLYMYLKWSYKIQYPESILWTLIFFSLLIFLSFDRKKAFK